MAPNIGSDSTLRSRKPPPLTTPSTPLPSKPLSNLSGHEIAIDGSIYDISNFAHPGGSVVKFFGGNDVSVQYRMIHASHTDDRHLSKMSLAGRVEGWNSGKVGDPNCDYVFNTPFEKEVKREVGRIVPRGAEFATYGFACRAAFYCALLATLMYVWASAGSGPMLAVAFGVSQALIGLNVQHDANHGAIDRSGRWNDFLGFGADMIGGSKYNWLQQHWTHHAFTNHNELDPDSFSAEPLMLFNDYEPNDPRRRWWHKFQSIYFLPVLSFYWLSMVVNPQLIDLQHAGTADVIMNWRNDYIRSKRYVGWVLRAVYLAINVLSPFLHHAPATALYHIWIFSTVESLMLSTLFSLSHNFESVDRDPTIATRNSKDGETKTCWAKSQVETSSTYGGHVAGWITGGLNFQIEHHLFPRMSSAWYPYIAPTVRKVCEKHGVKYSYYPTVFENLVSTFTYMHRSGNASHWVREWGEPLSGKD